MYATHSAIILKKTGNGHPPFSRLRIPRVQGIDEMLVLDAIRSMRLELIERLFRVIAHPFDQKSTNEEPGPVEPVMAMDADQRAIGGIMAGTQPIDQLDELLSLLRRRRDLGDGGELVVLDAAFLEFLGVVHGAIVTDIDDHPDPATPAPEELFRRMGIVDLTEGFHSAEDTGDRFGDGRNVRPLSEVLDVPFSFGGEVGQLPTDGQAAVYVVCQEGLDVSGYHAVGYGIVQHSVRCGSWQDLCSEDSAVFRQAGCTQSVFGDNHFAVIVVLSVNHLGFDI